MTPDVIIKRPMFKDVELFVGSCKLPKYVENIVDECNGAYDMADEEDRDFGVGWNSSIPVNSTR
jgi:hypothetical protein